MRTHEAVRLLLVLATSVAAVGCNAKSNRFCCSTDESCGEFPGTEITPCTDPDRPYCDDVGAYGQRHDCIPDPANMSCGAANDCKNAERPYCVDQMCVECDGNQTCESDTPVCAPDTHACVECVDSSTCSDTTPVCGDDRSCRGCSAHSECSSLACLPNGACADEAAVAYVSPTGTDNTQCTKATPCTRLMRALDTNRLYIKLSGSNNEGAMVSIDNQDVTLLGDVDAKLVRTSNGIVLEVKGTSHVSIYDLEISGGSGAQGIGISLPSGNTASLDLVRVRVSENAGGGISATGGTITVKQSNIFQNTGGGVTLNSSSFEIQNTVIAKNGNASSVFGGVLINQLGPGSRVLAFNTIANNVGQTPFTTGVTCQLIAAPVTFSNNIIYGNASGQVTGTNCGYTFSLIGPDAGPSGNGNLNADPLFVNATQNNFHIMTTSPAKDAADPAATLAIDIDGQMRPAGSARDIGADEAQ